MTATSIKETFTLNANTTSTGRLAYTEGSDKAKAIIERLDAFVRDEMDPLAAAHGLTLENSGSRELLQKVWKRSNALGFYGMTLPEAMGGVGLTISDQVLIKEFLYSTGTPLAAHILGELSGPPRVGALLRTATPSQMQDFLLPVARAEKAICFAITEAEAGSDAGALQTKAVRDGDCYILNGRKRYITGSPFADLAVVIASTSDDPDVRETTAFIVELGSPGCHVEGGYKTIAGQTSTADIVLQNCKVPVANRIGEEGRGLSLALGRITVNRLLHCPTIVGLARVALNDARDHALSRRQFGRPIADFQVIQHMLADMATELAAARALMLSVARQLDAGAPVRSEASMAKLFCSETAFRVADRAVQVLGGQGIVQGNRVEYLFRMLRMYRIVTGTSEIQRNTIAKELLGG